MGKKDKGTIQETEAERQLVQMSMDRYQQYKTKWQPIQQRAIQAVRTMGAPDSMERNRAVTRAAGDVGVQFDEGTEQAERASMNRGVDADSSNFRLRQAEMGQERAKAQGIAGSAAEGAVDQAYIEGLSGLMALGKTQADEAMRGSTQVAATSATKAATAAGIAAQRRAQNAALIGQIGGMTAAGIQTGAIKLPSSGGSGTGFGFTGENAAAPYTPGVDV